MITNQAQKKKLSRLLEGEVMTKSDKTLYVRVQIMRFHPKYQKRFACTSKYAVHDGRNLAKVGDCVQIQSCRPVSKTKKWSLVKVL
jgi:small subunit ribosomal protein S17